MAPAKTVGSFAKITTSVPATIPIPATQPPPTG